MYILSPIQEEALTKPCPHCGTGTLHPVEGFEDHAETYLHCDYCLLAMDSDGGYTY